MTYEVITNTENAINLLKSFPTDTPTFSDIETDGLYGYIRLIQVYNPTVSPTVYILDMDYLDNLDEYIKPLWTVFHNASYDFGCLGYTTDRFDDTQYLARSAYPQWQKFDLATVVDRLVGPELYEGLDKKALQKAGFIKGAYLSKPQLKYSATDVYALEIIFNDSMVTKCRDILAYKVDILALKYSVRYQNNKILVDQTAVRTELDNLVADIEKNSIILGTLNCNSPKQVKEALGTESSDKSTLIKEIGKGSTLAKAVYDQRRLLKRRTMLESYNYPWVQTKFNPAGAATGRFTSTGKNVYRGINAQQIPRDLQYIFNKNTEDTVVIHADYSTAELRAGCSIMGDETMYDHLKQGIDLHRVAATFALTDKRPEDITKQERIAGKAVSFGFIFGMSANSFVEYAYMNFGVKFTPEEAKTIRDNYLRTYKQIGQYAQRWWKDYKKVMVTTPMGRRNKARLGTDAINFATQGCIAETIKLAVHYMVKEDERALTYIYNVVHDAAYLRVPNGEEKYWGDLLARNMILAWKEICKLDMLKFKDIEMPVDLEYTDPNTGEHIEIAKV